MATVTLVAILLPIKFVNATDAGSGSGSDLGLDLYLTKSLDHFSQEIFGVESNLLVQFFNRMQDWLKINQDSFDTLNPAKNSAIDCLNFIEDNTRDRSILLNCLSDNFESFFTEAFAGKLFQNKFSRSQGIPDSEKLKTVNLITYFEDLIREKRSQNKLPSSWILDNGKYSQFLEKAEFPFEDGDIILGLGSSSISALIPNMTMPIRTYAHAFMVRVDPNPHVSLQKKYSILESIIEKGVVENSWHHFASGDYNKITVLRWKNKQTRKKIAKKASLFALNAATKKIPYDFAMDLNDPSKMFCSELVARAYANAADLAISDLVPYSSKIRSKEALQFLKNLRVEKEEMVSPGDLVNSPYLEAVAEWRNTNNIAKLWGSLNAGDLFALSLEYGYQIRPFWALELLPLSVLVLQLPFTYVDNDLRLIPKGINSHSMATMITLEKFIYQPVLKSAGIKNASLLISSPWELRAKIEWGYNQSKIARLHYSSKNKN